eukprot:16443630-Heterocapsa_arctica.AAC.1
MAPKRTLLEAAFESQAAQKQARARSSSSVFTQAQNALSNNFKQFSEQDIDSVIVDGLSLRARLTMDKA